MADKPDRSPPAAPDQQQPQVDIKQLADRVYQLMLAEVRLAKSRGVSTTRRGRE
jgi:hypothetical protein